MSQCVLSDGTGRVYGRRGRAGLSHLCLAGESMSMALGIPVDSSDKRKANLEPQSPMAGNLAPPPHTASIPGETTTEPEGHENHYLKSFTM